MDGIRQRSKGTLSAGVSSLSQGADEGHGVTRTRPQTLNNGVPASIKVDQLCRRCTEISWKQWVSPENLKGGCTPWGGNILGIIWESHAKLKESSCRVCQLIADLKSSIMGTRGGVLTAFSARDTFGRDVVKLERALHDSVLVSMTGTVAQEYVMEPCFFAVLNPEAGSHSQDIKSRNAAHTGIDFTWIRDRLKFCDQNHARTCFPRTTPAISGFRVIDCFNRRVVPAPKNCHYAALSYVWGAATSTHSKEFSPVVKDSISVTLALGLKYLWVDRYCIDQNDTSKHGQIASMDRIYAGSEMTIVAAAGDSAEYGLPGVNRRRTCLRQDIAVPGAVLRPVLPHLSYALRDSKWASRAWTYQEFFFSKRRLVFTDMGVSFICNGSYCPEPMKQPISALTVWGHLSFQDIMPSLSRGLEGGHAKFLGLQGHIALYSGKDLTHDSDALNACLGLLNSYSMETRQPIYHAWGVPLKPLWQAGVLMWLAWHHNCPTVRRDGFPSWSWVGWKGAVDFFGIHDRELMGLDRSFECQVRVKAQIQQDLQPLRDVLQRNMTGYGEARCPDLPQELHISGITIMLTFSSFGEETWRSSSDGVLISYEGSSKRSRIKKSDRGLHCVLPLSPTLTALAPAFLDQEMPTEFVAPCLVLFNSRGIPVCLMMLNDCGGVYERVGVAPIRMLEDHYELPRELSATFIDEDQNILDNVTIKLGSRPWMLGGESKTIKLR